LAIVLAAAVPAAGQLQGGTVVGTAADQTGVMLPGVTVTIRGADVTHSVVTDEQGRFRFLNLAPGAYVLTAALAGFTTVVHDRIVVEVREHVEIPLSLKVAAVSETVTVSGQSPVVDSRATGTATNFAADELTRILTSRDPFALMRAVPGVIVDRVNIAGNETGQQSSFVSKGTRAADAVRVPALRERPEDIGVLTAHLAAKYAAQFGRTISRIDRRTLAMLESYEWPGNVRELENVIARAVIVSDGEVLQIPAHIFSGPTPAGDINRRLQKDERDAIEAALRASRGRVAGPDGAARRLGLPASTLESRIQRLGVDKHRYRNR
jgi:Carboxypeptidase regulatory-like domain/Bacterial regulatory protein, Fis family